MEAESDPKLEFQSALKSLQRREFVAEPVSSQGGVDAMIAWAAVVAEWQAEG